MFFGRRIYCPIDKGRRLPPIPYVMAPFDLSHHLYPLDRPHSQRALTDPIRQPSSTTIRLDSSHPHSVRSVHYLCHRRERRALSRL